LLAFSVPVILLLTLQTLLSRAPANWAAAAYPAATILVTAELLRHWPRLFRISLGLHLGAALVITFAPKLTELMGPTWNPLCARARLARLRRRHAASGRGERRKVRAH
jgi:hypothetical protein